MALPATPSNFYSQTGNRTNYLSWDLVPGATSYKVQRSTDGVNYSLLASPTAANYLDSAVTVGNQYWYQVAAVSGVDTSLYTAPQSLIPAPDAEMSLAALRLAAQQRADRVNSQFVTLPEWNSYINQSMFELYDLLVTSFEDYFLAPEITFNAVGGTTFQYPLPDGVTTFTEYPSGNTIVAPPFYKLAGVDLAINSASNGFVTLNKFNLIDRNRFVYPNSNSTIYGVFNLRYRVLGNKIQFIPTPTSGQTIRLLYVPRLPEMLADTDLTTIGYSGWLEYVIIDAAIKALQKEESDVSVLMAQKMAIKARIEETAQNRDQGRPDIISDVRGSSLWGGTENGWNGTSGAGW